MKQFPVRLCGVLFFILASAFLNLALCQAYKFAELAGTPMVTTGWNLQGAAQVGNTGNATTNEELILTKADRSQSGAIFYNTGINLAACNLWYAEFEFRINGGSGADGIAFCYLDVPPSGFVLGEGLGIPAVANGLKVAIDTYWNCGGDRHPKVQIRYGFGYKECEPLQPTVNNNDGALDFIRNGQYHKCRITYDKGNITVSINGKEYLKGFQTFNFKGFFGFTAATGNAYDNHSVKNVRIYTDMPPSDAGNGSTICSGSTAQLGIPVSDPTYRYLWAPATGINNTAIHNPTTTLNHAGPAKLVQKYYVYTEFARNPGCASVDSVNIVVNPSPNVTFNTAGVCQRDTTKITPKTNWPDSLLPKLTWQWNFNDPLSAPADNTSTAMVGSHLYANSGTYNISLTTTTADGCVKQNVGPLVIKKLPLAGFRTVNPGSLCFNQNVKFVHTTDAGNRGFTSIMPDSESGNPLVRYNRMIPRGDSVAINFRSAGVRADKPYYVVKWMNTDTSGCTASATDTIRFLTQPKPVFNAMAGICLDVPAFQITAHNELTGIPGTGRFSGKGITDPVGVFNARVAGVGTHALLYVFAAQNGCTDTAAQQLSVFPLPAVEAGPDRYILPGGAAYLTGSSAVTPSSILWSPAAGLSNAAILNPVATPAADQLYYLSITTAQGCKGQDSALVKVLPALTIPNVFSPHLRDGINDVWIIRNLEFFPESIVQVYDRYGRLIHNNNGYNTPWDGKINGVLVPVGVYYYIVNPKNGEKIYTGSITLL